MKSYRYSQWDGSQQLSELHEDDLMEALSDDLLTHGDIAQALRNLLHRGLTGHFGNHLPGIRELMQRLRQQRRATLDKYDLGSTVDELKQKLQHIVDTEKQGITERLDEARRQSQAAGSEQPGLQALEKVADKNLAFLENLPPDMGGAIKQLSGYDFLDPQARREFQELMDILKQHVMDSLMKDLSQRLQGLTPDDLSRLNDMMREMNRMLRDREQGLPPDFEGFMDRFGDMFGAQRPQSFEELLDALKERMAQAQSLLNSLAPSARQALNDLLNSIIDANGLREEMNEFAFHMQMLLPTPDMESSYIFQGEEPLSLQEALRLMEDLQRIDQLENQLDSVRWGKPLEAIDAERLREMLGEEAHQALEQWKRVLEKLEDTGFLQRKGQRLELTPKAIRKIGQKALQDVFEYIKREGLGRHPLKQFGAGGDISDETKSYEYGDPFLLHLEKTVRNAVNRRGPGVPVRMDASDFEVFRTEQATRCTTVLLIDLSWSMPARGNFLAAKKVALALENLIHTQFPRDTLYIVGFSDYARQLKAEALTQLSWNEYVYGTNMQHAFMLSRQLLSRHKGGNRQIIMVTDGEPTAHLEENRVYFDYPPHPRTLQLTLLEAKRCAEDGITINAFMLDRGHYYTQFMDQLARISRGRVFFTSAKKLGQYVLVDYLSNKRRRVSF